MDFENGVQFDPGFVQYISAFIPNIEYAYANLNSYKNFGQKKAQFRMVYPKIIRLLNNYIGFYAGCILWAVGLSTLENKPILGNYSCGAEYNEEETLQEVNFIIEYLDCLVKDVKYYLGQTYTPDADNFKILEAYREFLKVNKGFTELKTTDDIVLPECVNRSADAKQIFDKIEAVIDSGNLSEMKNFLVTML